MHVDHHGYRRAGRSKYEHRVVAEQALGRPLLKGEVVHHIDYDKTNNAPNNLVICSQATHLIIHARTDAIRAGFNPDTHALCSTHKEYLPKEKFYKHKGKWNGVDNLCTECRVAYRRAKGYKTVWDERAKELQRRRRAKVQ